MPGPSRDVQGAAAVGAGLLVLALYLVIESRRLPLGSLARPGPRFLPLVLAAALAVVAIILLAAPRGTPSLRTLTWPERRHAIGLALACLVTAAAIEPLGFRLTMLAVMTSVLLGLERRRPGLALGLAALGAWGSFWIFHDLLGVPMPRGPWGI